MAAYTNHITTAREQSCAGFLPWRPCMGVASLASLLPKARHSPCATEKTRGSWLQTSRPLHRLPTFLPWGWWVQTRSRWSNQYVLFLYSAGSAQHHTIVLSAVWVAEECVSQLVSSYSYCTRWLMCSFFHYFLSVWMHELETWLALALLVLGNDRIFVTISFLVRAEFTQKKKRSASTNFQLTFNRQF